MSFALMALVVLAAPLTGDAEADRLEPVIAARMDLQRNLRADLEGALGSMLAPHRVLVTVEAVMQAHVRENTRTDETPGTEIQVKPMRQVELPGLPVVRQQMVGAGTPQMEYRVPARKITERTSTIDAELTRLTVRVFLDEEVPPSMREEVKRIAVALTGLDLARGDLFELLPLPGPPAKSSFERLPPPWLYSIIAVLVALVGALLVAVLVALGVGRRAGPGTDVHVGVAESQPAMRDDDARADDPASENAGPSAPSASLTGPLAELAGCSLNELAAIVEHLPETDGAVLLSSFGVDQSVVQRVFARLPLSRQLALGQWLVTSHQVDRAEVERVAGLALRELGKVRSVVSLGGAEQLARLVVDAPEDTLKHLFETLATRDETVAAELRRRMPFFEDLEHLDAPAIRGVVTQVDPALLAVALTTGTPALRERVYGSVSKRLRSMLQSEAEGLTTPSREQSDGARRHVERIMRRARVQKPPQPTAT